MKLTIAQIKAAKPADKPYKLSDGEGLSLNVSRAGGKTWRLKYRIWGKEKQLTIGSYPEISLKDARERKADARKLIANGGDPSAEKQAEKAEAKKAQAGTFEAVAAEWLDRQEVAAITASKNRWLFETYLFPSIGKIPISELTPRQILDTLRKIEAAGKLETAARAKIKISQVFRYAVIEGFADTDPTASLRGALKPVQATNHAALTNPEDVAQLLRAIDGFAGEYTTLKGLQLIALVFVRPGELRHAEWSEIDWNQSLWRIPAAKMKTNAAHNVPLSEQALEILKDLYPLTGHGGGYIFPSVRTASRPMSENTLTAGLRRLGYSNDEQTAHGFRTTASTLLNEQGWQPDLIEKQLAHADRDKVRSVYNKAEHLQERRDMMQSWADYLDDLRANK